MTRRRSWMSLPTALTVSRFFAAPVLIVLCRLRSGPADVAAFLVLAAAMVTDAVDGYAARKTGDVTDLGRLIDPLADAFVYIGLFLCLCLEGWMPLWMFVVILYRELVMHGLLRRLLLMKGIVLAASKLGKFKTAFQTVGGLLALGCIAALRIAPDAVGHLESGMRTATYWALFGATLTSAASLASYTAFAVRKLRAGG